MVNRDLPLQLHQASRDAQALIDALQSISLKVMALESESVRLKNDLMAVEEMLCQERRDRMK